MLDDLIGGAYAAALDDALWSPWADRLTEALGGAGSTFVVLDTATGAVERMMWSRARPAAMEQYQSLGLATVDPQMSYAASLTRSGFYLDTDHVDYSDPGVRNFMHWMRSNAG